MYMSRVLLIAKMQNMMSGQPASSQHGSASKGVRQRCNLSPRLFNILAEQLMLEAPQGFSGEFKIGGKTISSFRYADNIVLLATSPEELHELVCRVAGKGV
jgi:hypothetical protein